MKKDNKNYFRYKILEAISSMTNTTTIHKFRRLNVNKTIHYNK